MKTGFVSSLPSFSSIARYIALEISSVACVQMSTILL